MNKSIMTNYWAFLADPTRYHIEKAIHSKEADTWVTRGRKIKAGDKVIVWKSARDDGKRGMVALGEVLTDPEMLTDNENPFWVKPPKSDEAEERVRVRYVLLPNLPLWLHEDTSDVLNSLSVSRARGGTVFTVTPEQYQALISKAGGPSVDAPAAEVSQAGQNIAKTRNPPWSREELILALDLFFQLKPAQVSKDNSDVIALSQLLNALPLHIDRPDAARSRNPNGVSMKLLNFFRFNPTYPGVGLERGGKLEGAIWNEFAHDRERLRSLAEAIRAELNTPPEELLDLPPVDGDFEAPEGRLLLRIHKKRERSANLVKRRKGLALQTAGVLRCEACGMVYSEKYGPLGEGYIECHHTVPVSQLRPGQTTSLKDLALVCADCHRMLHRGGDLLTVEALKKLIAKYWTVS